MAANSAQVFSTGRKYFGNAREPWSLTIMGEDTYIITSPTDILAVYRETVKLDPDAIVKDVLADFGVSLTNVNKLFDRRGTSRHAMDHCHDLFKTQLHPGDHLEALQDIFLANIDALLNWDRIAGPMVLASHGTTSRRVSLWKWCRNVLVDSATRAFSGNAIYRVAPNIVDDFFLFDDEAWKLPYRYPKFAARTMYDAKARCEAAFSDFLALPKQERADASWIVGALEKVYEDLGIDEPTQRGPMLFSLHRVTNSNAYRLCFWSVAHLLHNPNLLEAIKSEMKPAMTRSADKSVDMSYLLDSCPRLASFYEEILRITNDPIGIRLVAQKVTIGGKVLEPGRKVLMPYRQMHYDSAVFGKDVAKFDSDRFLNNHNLYRSSSWKPFGGGTMYCPGRFLAKREVYMFLALFLFRFDVKLAPASPRSKIKLPDLDETIPAGGILPPVPGGDVIVDVTPVSL